MDKVGSVRFKIGYWDLENDKGIDVRATRIFLHSKYSKTTLANDIAVVKISEKVKFSKSIQPLCLPDLGKIMVSNIKISTKLGIQKKPKCPKNSDCM